MKKLMNRAGLLAAAFALALAVALALNAAMQTPAAQASNVLASDGDDEDRLIEITTPAQLDMMRWDPNGDGAPSDDADINGDGKADAADRAMFSSHITCSASPSNTAGASGASGPTAAGPTTTSSCNGYELANHISLAGNWTPIPNWSAVFDGNMFRVTGLEVKNNPGPDGLFGSLGSDAVVKHVMVDAVVIESSGGHTGALAGSNYGTIIGSYATGKLTSSLTSSSGSGAMGGLVGYNKSGGKIYASVAKVEVKVKGKANVMRAAGFVGMNRGEIRQSYAYGDVIEIRNNNSHRINLRGFAPNQGTVDRSISYGDLIVKISDTPNAPSPPNKPNEYPAPFGGGATNSCALADEYVVTCPTPTPTPTGD